MLFRIKLFFIIRIIQTMSEKASKSFLIFEPDISGHKLEYIHHLFEKAKIEIENQYVFVINENYIHNTTLDWSGNTGNIKFDLLPIGLNDVRGFTFCRLLKEKVVFHGTDNIFLISLMRSLPFLPLFFLNTKVRISGIIYLIYLYRWKKASLYVKFMDVLKFLIFSRIPLFDKIFILNDKVSPVVLNKLYSTHKFIYLPDPFFPLKEMEKSISECVKIPDGVIVYLHFGALSRRKGTLNILKAVELLPMEDRKKYCFVFAGRISESIRGEFDELLVKLKVSTNFIIIDKFCDYQLLGYLCKVSDYILMPYKETAQSSGVIGYAAQFLCPVIAPSEGLIGKLVRRYKMGFCIKGLNPYNLCDFIKSNKRMIVSDFYLKEHSIDEFNKVIMK